MPVNNALTPEGSNALGAAFGYYPQLKKYRQFNDPVASSEMPLQFMRGRLATTMGTPSDILNMFRSPNPMEVYGDVNYAPQQQVPYGSQELMQTLPLPPTSPAGQLAGNVGSVVPLSPTEILQSARLARQATLAGGKVAKKGARLVGDELNATMLGERPNTLLSAVTPQPMFASSPSRLNLEKGIYKPELTMEEMVKVKDIPTVDRVKQSIDLVGEDQFKKMVNAQYKKYKPTDQDQEAMLVESVTLQILGKAQRSPYPQQEALRLAQERASLPVEQGGLGLPKDNTPEMRAQSMGFDLNNPQYHATDVDFLSIRPSLQGKLGAGVYVSPSSPYAEKYTSLNAAGNARVLPLVARGKLADDDVAMNIAESIRQEMFAQNPNFSVFEWKKRTTQALTDAGYDGRSMSGLENVITNPSNLRSRFAAFDPFRKDVATATAMGVLAPDLLAAQQDPYSQNEMRKFMRQGR